MFDIIYFYANNNYHNYRFFYNTNKIKIIYLNLNLFFNKFKHILIISINKNKYSDKLLESLMILADNLIN